MRTYTDQQILDAIRTTDALGAHTGNSHNDHVRALGLPSHATAASRFGTWNKARQAAGVAVHNSPRGTAGGGGARGGGTRSSCTAHFWVVEKDGRKVHSEYEYPRLHELKKLGFPDPSIVITRVNYTCAA